MTRQHRRVMRNALAGVGALLLLVLGIVGWRSSTRLIRPRPAEARSIILPAVPDTARGERLGTAISLCTRCHGPDLGGHVLDDNPVFRAAPPNLTTGKGGIGNRLTLVAFANAVRRGIHPDRTSLLLMPSQAWSGMSDADLVALWTWVRSRPPVDRSPGRTFVKFPGRVLLAMNALSLSADSLDPAPPPARTPADTVGLGSYLAQIAGCTYCHGPDLRGRAEPVGPPGSPLPPDISRRALEQWSSVDFVRALRTGVRPDGSAMSTMMPWQAYAKMTDEELRALWEYLRRETGSW